MPPKITKKVNNKMNRGTNVERKVEILQEKEDVIIFNIRERGVIDNGINIYPNKEVQKVVTTESTM